MLTFDARVKNSDAAQPRVTNVKTPIVVTKETLSPNPPADSRFVASLGGA